MTGTSWKTPQKISVDAYVRAGPTTIAVYGDSNAPDIDMLAIT
ncbi:hypothetical protein ACIBEF_31320 [Micromonospora sp. NPDC050795]